MTMTAPRTTHVLARAGAQVRVIARRPLHARTDSGLLGRDSGEGGDECQDLRRDVQRDRQRGRRVAESGQGPGTSQELRCQAAAED